MPDSLSLSELASAPEPELAQGADYVFDLDGGRVCLDFVNTLGFSGVDHLSAYADLIRFASQSGLITPAEAIWLQAEAERDPVTADRVLARAKQLRRALRGLFGTVAAGSLRALPAPPVGASDLDQLNADLGPSLAHARVLATPTGAGGGLGYVWGWSELSLDAPIWPIARSAADLLVSDHERGLVRQCGASDCAWLFLDTSKNRSRQWCSMQSCGNREKARRHYQRQRASRSGKPPDRRDGSANTPDADT